MNTEQPYYSIFLKNLLVSRCQRNSAYSLRAFAQSLKSDAGTISSIINLKRPLSLKKAEQIISILNPTETERQRFLSSVVLFYKSRDLKRKDPKVSQFNLKKYKTLRALDVEIYHMIADWYHAAILELTYQNEFTPTPSWISKQLGITYSEAKVALDRLLQLELIEEKEGKFHKVNDHLDLLHATQTSSVRKKKQIQIRQKSIEAIEIDTVESRYMTSVTMCIDPKLLPEARKRIDEFNDSLCAFLESGERKEVYCMELGLFSLQKIKTHKEEKL